MAVKLRKTERADPRQEWKPTPSDKPNAMQ
jgi:hypothetical protein